MSEASRFSQVDEIFRGALRLPPEQRAPFLLERCGDDRQLRADVEELLREDARTRGELDGAALGERLSLSAAGFFGSPVAPEPIPERIGPYRVVSRIGEGGMGTVYEAEQENPRRRVAVKVIGHGLASAATLRRFEQEAQVLGRLEHPGIARIYEAGVQQTERGARPFFAMELVRGEPLLTFARQRGLRTRGRLELFARICDAVNHAHQRGVVHRDLKPANILVDERGQPRVLDFGVARAIDTDAAITSRTDAGQIIGTLAYMSPEQASGDPNDVDTRADVYALGVVGYELLAGRLPYDVRGRSIPDALRVVCESEPTPLSSTDRTLRGDVQTILAKAMEKNKQRRYDSAAALADDVRRYLTDQPISARAPSASYQVAKFAQRHRPLVVAAVAIVAGLAFTTAFSALQADRARAAARQKEEFARIAEEERRLAVKRFDDVRSLSKALIFDIHDAVVTVPGSIIAREKIVSEGLRYLDALAAEMDDNPDLIIETAAGYSRVAELLGNPGASSLGKYAESRAAFERGLALLARVPEPTGEKQRLGWAATSSRLNAGLSNLLLYMGHAEDALEHARIAADVVRPLKDQSQSLTGALATAIARRVQALSFMGRFEEAIEAFQEGHALDQQVFENGPETHRTIARRNLISNYTKLGGLYRFTRDAKASQAAYRRALELVDQTPEEARPTVRRHRNAALVGLAKSLRLGGEPRTALTHLQAALTDFRSLVREDPPNIRPRQDLLVVLQDVGDVEVELGELDSAHEHFLEHLALSEDLLRATPESVDVFLSIAFVRTRLGDLARARGHIDDALSEYTLSLEWARRGREKGPNLALGYEVEMGAHRKLAECALERSGEAPEARALALSHARAAMDVLREMESRGISASNVAADRSTIEALLQRVGSGG